MQNVCLTFAPAITAVLKPTLLTCAGISFGRTPLIKLSPKKTVEGFIGGAIGTMAASFFLTWCFAQFRWMYCPRDELSFGSLHCDVPEVWSPVQYRLTDLAEVLPDFVVEDLRPLTVLVPAAVRSALSSITWTCMPAQMHAIALAAFASLIGPFGAGLLLAFHKCNLLVAM